MKKQTRDENTTDALITRGFSNARAADDCPAPEVLAAFCDRALEADEVTRWIDHMADCRRCQALLAAIGRAESDADVEHATSTAAPWWRWRVLAPVAALSIVVLAVWVVDPGWMLDRRLAMENRQDPPATQPEHASAAAGGVPESATVSVTGTDQTPVSEAVAVPRAQAAAAATEPAPRVPSAATPASTPAATENAVGRPEALSLLRNALVRDAAPRREPARFATTAAPVTLLIVSPDPATRWRVAPGGAVERSDDSGATWLVQVSPGERAIAGSAPSARVAWLVGENGLVLRTTDGDRWERTTAPVAAHLTDIDAIDGIDATVATADGRRFRTVDGGARWTPVP